MPNWKKVITSGSDAVLNSLSVTAGLTVTGSAIISGSLGITGSFNQASASLATGLFAHAQGLSVTASGIYSHAEGLNTVASGQYSHAEGAVTLASGRYSHAEGGVTTATGDVSHTEGHYTTASGDYSHAEGFNTVASGRYQHVQGQYNLSSSAQSAFIVGNGTGVGALRSNLIFASGSTLQVTGSVIATAGFTGSLSGSATFAVSSSLAAAATILQTPRTIGGVSFDGSANINLPGVNSTGNQNTSGNATTATTSTYILSADTRAVASTPQTNDAPQGIRFDFKQNSTNGLSDGGTYNGVMYFRKYGSSTDWTGGGAHEIGFTDSGNLHHRYGINTTWGSWYKVLDSNNYNSYSPTLTGTGASGTWGITSSVALTASFALSAAAFPFTGSARITGSLGITGSLVVKQNATTGSLNTSDRTLLDNSNKTSIDWGSRFLYDSQTPPTMSAYWDSRILYSNNGVDSVNWNNRYLYSSVGALTVDWEHRQLDNEDSEAVLDWSVITNGYAINSYYYYRSDVGLVQQQGFIDTVPAVTNLINYAGEAIRATVDVNVVTHDLVFLDTDGIWYQVTQGNQTCTKLIGICLDKSAGIILLEGTLTVLSTHATYSDSPLVQGVDSGLPIYIKDSNGTNMSTASPTNSGQYVRVLGHAYQQGSTYADYWIMKFRPSNDWITI